MKHLESIKTFNPNGAYKRVWEYRYDREISKEKVAYMKNQNYIPCAITTDGEIHVFTEDAKINLEKWKTVYFFTKEEFEKVNKVSTNIKNIKEQHLEAIKLYNKYVESFIHHHILKKED